MRGLAALARREIEEHRIALLAALVAGLLAAGAPLLQFHGENPGEVREAAAVFVALAFAAGLSISLGSSVLSREIANRRIGFFFARPISAAAIWGGKLAASAAIAAGAAALVFLPSFLLNRARFSQEIGSILLAGVALAVAVLLPITHALAVVFRSRSPRLGTDLALFVMVSAAIAFTSRWLIGETAVDAWQRAAIALSCLLLGAVVAGGFAAVARGRADIQDAHRALSRLLWPVALGAAALFAAYAKWIVSVGPGDLAWIWVSPAPRGDWATVSGGAPSHVDNAAFLLETSTGKFVKLKNFYVRPVFSADGRAAVWLETSNSMSFLSLLSRPEWMGSSRPVRFYRFALGESAGPSPTGVLLSSPPHAWAISSDGTRLAAISDETGGASANVISVYELSTARLLAGAAMPRHVGAHLLFATPDRLRIYMEESLWRGPANEVARQLVIYEMDVAGKKLTETGRMGPFDWFLVLRTDAGASRAIVFDPHGRKMTLHDGRSGQQIAVLSSGEKRSRNAAFLGDGRIVQVESSDTGTRMRIFSSNGEEQRMVPIRFGPGWRIGLGGETAPGVVVVAVRSERTADWKDSECLLVDTRTGQTRTIGEHLSPAAAMAWWGRHDPSWYPAAGSEATRLFLDARGSLLRLDPSTGKRRVILAGRPPP